MAPNCGNYKFRTHYGQKAKHNDWQNQALTHQFLPGVEKIISQAYARKINRKYDNNTVLQSIKLS